MLTNSTNISFKIGSVEDVDAAIKILKAVKKALKEDDVVSAQDEGPGAPHPPTPPPPPPPGTTT